MKCLSLLFFLLIFFTNPTYSQETIHVPGDYSTIQEAIYAANNGDIVLVAEDTYYENINFNGKAITVASQFFIDGDETHIDNTIIDGSQPSHPDSGSVVSFVNGEDTTSVLCGFTITGGTHSNGGGINCASSGAKIIFNKITNNLSTSSGGSAGGGISVCAFEQSIYLIIENNIISNNVAKGGRGMIALGGGIFIYEFNGSIMGRILNNFITQNEAFIGGSGLDGWGGGICINGGSLLISNNIIANNILEGAFAQGGGIFIDDGQVILIDNTIVNNKAGIGGGILLIVEAVIIDNIIWGNTAIADSQIYDYTGNLQIYYSDIQGGWSGIGNIDAYPEFVDTANGDYHLANSSPCIGAGIDSLEIGGMWYYCPLTDLEGNPRPNPLGTMPDMGAYESPLSVSGIEDYLSQVPEEYSIEQNYPNPFNPSTNIRYSVPQSSNVVIKVFDILGNEIETLVDEEKHTGTYEITWYAENLPSGVYFYRIQAGSFVETKKMVLMK